MEEIYVTKEPVLAAFIVLNGQDCVLETGRSFSFENYEYCRELESLFWSEPFFVEFANQLKKFNG